MTESPADRLRRARMAKGIPGPTEAAARFGWNKNTYASNENGNATFSFKSAVKYGRAFGVRPEWLYYGLGEMAATEVAVIGYVGASPDGQILFATGDSPNAFTPLPPGGTTDSVALEVDGHSMRGFADHGSLIYFEDQRTPPTADMIGEVVVVETEDGRVLVKRLQRGSAPGLYNLESLAGPTLKDARIVWAAHVTAVIPPRQARRIIRRTGEAA